MRPDWVVPGDDAAAHYLARLRDGAAPGGALDAVQAVALFPGELARNPASQHLATALHDVPWDDPPLLARLAEGRPVPGAPPPVRA